MNAMGKSLGFQDGDILMKMNGEAIPDLGPDFPPFIQRQLFSLPTAKELSYTVLRKDSTGVAQEVELKAPVHKIDQVRRHNIAPGENPTPEQLATRQAWLKP